MPFCTSCGSPLEGAVCPKCGQPNPAAASPGAQSISPPPRKSGIWMWVLGGCAGIVVLAGIALVGTGWFIQRTVQQEGPAAIIKMINALNPGIEVMTVDEKAGKVRIREKSTGKVMTIDIDQARQGRIVFTDEEGKRVEIGGEKGIEVDAPGERVRIGAGEDSQPSWLPRYPGAKNIASFSKEDRRGDSGSVNFVTEDSVEKVAAFYREALQSAGMNPEVERTDQAGVVRVARVEGKDPAKGREVEITITGAADNTMVVVTFKQE